MRFFKDAENNIYAYEDGDEHDRYIKQGLLPITTDEALVLTQSAQSVLSPSLTAWQIRKVLTQFGLRSAVESAISVADQNTKDAWEYASEYKRDNDLLLGMAQALGLTDDQLDSMFEIGVTL